MLFPVLDVPVVVRYTAIDVTPCVTIVKADEYFLKRMYVEIKNKQYIRKKYSCDLWINIWANDERSRHDLIDDVNNRILEAEANHYSTCANFNCEDKSCKLLNATCKSLTATTPRTLKMQCPLDKGYINFFKHNKILKNTFKIESTTNLDDLSVAEPVLRTIFKLNFQYYKDHLIGGSTFNKFEIDEEIL